jgi:hypothetical protein
MRGIVVVLAIAWAGLASSQQVAPSRRSASFSDAAAARAAEVEALDPAVDVGNSADRGERARAASRSEPAIAPVQERPSLQPAQEPKPARASGTETDQQAETVRQARASKTPRSVDHVDLGTTSITGNQELPKVLYIVPWKRSDLGEVVGRPVNTLLDEVLAPVDRDVFKRHLEYYDALFDSTPAGSGNAAGADKE